MNDDRMDEMLIEGARDYNEPGAVPREEIWARIQRARRTDAGAGVRARERHRNRLWVWPSVGVAAAAVLAVGVVIGRRMERPPRAAVVATDPSSSPARPDTSNPRSDERVASVSRSPSASANSDANSDRKADSLIHDLREQTKRTGRRVEALVAAAPRTSDTTASAPTDRRSRQQSSDLAYRLVVLQHLAGSEAMITSFQATARRGEIDAQIASWSRDLLSTTRMLEASPASDDPMMKRLLEDLELVITQIAQYAARGTKNTDDLDLIEQSINKRGVMAKLRSTIPARVPAAGT
jgi:hypothetical protein